MRFKMKNVIKADGSQTGSSFIGTYTVEPRTMGTTRYFHCTLECINGKTYAGKGSWKSAAVKKAFESACDSITVDAVVSLL